MGENGSVEFYLTPNQKDTKSNFLSLHQILARSGKAAVFRRTDKGYLLVVVPKPQQSKQRLKIPLILFAATLAAVFADGYLRASSYSDPSVPSLSTNQDVTFALIYVASLIGILGIHELGHKVASWYHKMNSSWPYFIPGIPSVLPTFGAVIRAADPPPNRDALFDLGFSGPIAGLVVTVLVSVFAALSAHLIPTSSFPTNTPFGSVDYYTSFLLGVFKPASSGQVVTGPLFELLYFAYSFGFFVTFINLLPAWQLDGGHIANSAVSPKVHQYLTYASIGIMLITGLWLMAILLLFFSSRVQALKPLDDVSPLSNSRKVLFVVTFVMAAAIGGLVILNNPIFGLGLFKL
jgi:membrane-associated protease RseP (regulator of RpoE activity)